MEFIVSYKSKNKIEIFNTIEELAEFLGNFWMQKTDNLIEGEFYSIALSGGSTPIKIFNYLSENFNTKIEWNKIRFFWGDERCVPPTNTDSNYKLANDYLFSKIELNEANIFRMRGEKNPEEEAISHSKILEDNLPKENGSPKFDFVLLGLGEDGHTASIFPHQIELFSSPNHCEVAEHPTSGQRRITITGNIINNSEMVVIVAVGKNKANRVYEIVNQTEIAKNYPASMVNPNNGIVNWFLDVESSRRV